MHYSGSAVGTGNVHFLTADARGSIIYEANRFDGNRQVNAYDPFRVPDQDNGGRFGYTGQAYVPEIGMFYYKARMYSPTLGRFMQTDPIGYADGMNMYAYVGNDPVNFVDPTGLNSVLPEPNGSCLDFYTFNPKTGKCDPDDIVVSADRITTYIGGGESFMYGSIRVGGPGVFFGHDFAGQPIILTVIQLLETELQNDDSVEPGLLECLTDAGGAALDGFLSPGEQLTQLVGATATTLFEAESARRDAARGRPSAVGGRRNTTIVPGSNVRLTPGQALAKGAKRFVPGYAVFSGAVALWNGGVAAFNSEGCRNLVR